MHPYIFPFCLLSLANSPVLPYLISGHVPLSSRCCFASMTYARYCDVHFASDVSRCLLNVFPYYGLMMFVSALESYVWVSLSEAREVLKHFLGSVLLL